MTSKPVPNHVRVSVAAPPPAPRPVGFVGLAGAPNVGKSTLVNHLVGQKVSIVSDRPQTTRERICGIYTDEHLQAVLVDIPGIMGGVQARDTFNRALLETVHNALAECDVILHLRDARRARGGRGDDTDQPVRELLARANKPLWLLWNKIDRVPGRLFPSEPPASDTPHLTYARVFGVSGKTGRGLPAVLEALAARLPHGPLLYDPDQLSDRNLRHLAAELVREKLFRYLGEELPYQLTTLTEKFEEPATGKAVIGVTILTERAAHKPIIIGQNGQMLRKIGQAARLELEKMLERPVFLELWVKVRPKWRKDEQLLAELGLKSGNSS